MTLTFSLDVHMLEDVTRVSLVDLALYGKVITLSDLAGDWQLLYKLRCCDINNFDVISGTTLTNTRMIHSSYYQMQLDEA